MTDTNSLSSIAVGDVVTVDEAVQLRELVAIYLGCEVHKPIVAASIKHMGPKSKERMLRILIWSNERRGAAVAEKDAQIGKLKVAFRVNALRWDPSLSHEQITDEIERIVGEVTP